MDLLEADALLFDLDGVLVDSRMAFARSVNAALAEHGLPERADDELHRYLGPPLHRTFASLGAVDGQVDALVMSYRARYRATMSQQGDPGYKATSVLLGECGLALALDRDQLSDLRGVLTPATALGDALLTRLPDAGVTLRTERL